MSIVDSLDRTCRRLDEMRASVRWTKDVGFKGGSDAERRASNEIRAASFVVACGAMEQFFREFVEWLCSEIERLRPQFEEVRLSLHSIASADDFRSLQHLRDRDRIFERRMRLLERTVSEESCRLQVRHDELGLNGETIRPDQVSNVWSAFGLPGSGFGDIHQQISLRVFADNRNDYAHGKVDIDAFLANPECAADSILRRISDLENWCFHCWDIGLEYLADEGYRR